MTDIHYIGKSKYDPDQFGREQVKFLRWFFGDKEYEALAKATKEREKKERSNDL